MCLTCAQTPHRLRTHERNRTHTHTVSSGALNTNTARGVYKCAQSDTQSQWPLVVFCVGSCRVRSATFVLPASSFLPGPGTWCRARYGSGTCCAYLLFFSERDAPHLDLQVLRLVLVLLRVSLRVFSSSLYS